MNVGHWRKWLVRMGLAAVIVCLAVQSVLAAGANPGVLPPQSSPHGATYREWSARWWQWAYLLPADQNPFFDETGCANGANGQSGSVWFLTGVLNTSGIAERTCTVPTGKALFFPLINVECSTAEAPPFYGADEEELRACVRGFRIADVFATVDGMEVKNLGDPSPYSVESPLFFFTLPENNVLGLPAGDAQSVSSGYYLMLAPLSAGEHTVHFGGRYPDFDFALDITYHLTVAPGR